MFNEGLVSLLQGFKSTTFGYDVDLALMAFLQEMASINYIHNAHI
jgi:hypothetical protein